MFCMTFRRLYALGHEIRVQTGNGVDCLTSRYNVFIIE